MGTVLSVLLFAHAAPISSASWMSAGQVEPNSVYDDPAFMFSDTPPVGASRIYFNGLIVQSHTGLNPNTGLVGGSVLIPGQHFAIAVLGVWKDCNRDGYIGMAETLLLEYPVTLLGSTTACPERGLQTGSHNDGTWVHEIRWIGWENNAANPQGRVPGIYDDQDVRVWGDDELPWTRSFVGCPLNPPTGTFSSTGGILAWTDCYGKRGLISRAGHALDLIGQNHPANDFENQEFPQCSQSNLNVHLGIFYRDPRCPAGRPGILEPGTAQPTFVVWDCDSGIPVDDHEGRELYFLHGADPAIYRVDGSVYDAASHVIGGVEGQCAVRGGSSLDPTYVALHPEQPFVATTIKRETTFAFEFFSDRTGSHVGRIYEDPSTPPHFGVYPLNNLGFFPIVGGSRMGPGWQAQVSRHESPPLLRDSLLDGGIEAAPPAYYTFYAFVGQTTRDRGHELPTGSTGTYGSYWCEHAQPLVVFGVDCDPNSWWKPEHGASAMPIATWNREPIGVTIGQPYNLRDIDCYDGEIAADTAFYASASWFTSEICTDV